MCVNDCIDVDRDVYCWDWEGNDLPKPFSSPTAVAGPDAGYSEHAATYPNEFQLNYADEVFTTLPFQLCDEFSGFSWTFCAVEIFNVILSTQFACIELPPPHLLPS